MNILYVEDNPDDALLTERHFERHAPQHRLRVFRTQDEALAFLASPEASSVDLVLTDMHLEEGDGLVLLLHIRTQGLPVPVVIVTGERNEEKAVTALKAGADHYVVKKAGYLQRLPGLLEEVFTRHRMNHRACERPLSVLYAEPSPEDRDLTRIHFRRHAPLIRLETVQTGPEVLSRFEGWTDPPQYELLLLDLRLPEMGAEEVLRELRQVRGIDIPVVIVTGKGDEEKAVEVMRLGASHYVVKHNGYLDQLPNILVIAHSHWELSRERTRIEESRRFYASLLDCLPDPVWVKNRDHRWVLVNEAYARLLETPPESLLGRSEEDFFPGEKALETRAKEDRLLETGTEVLSEEALRVPAPGKVRLVQTKKILYVDPRGGRFIVAVGRDTTEERRMELQLRQAQKFQALGTLAGGIAHDFNNILSIVMGFTQLIADATPKGSLPHDYGHEIIKAVNRAADLVRQILTFCRSRERNPVPIMIEPLAKEAVKMLRASLPSSIEIRTTIKVPGWILADPTQIFQILLNLASNGAHAMKDRGGVLEIVVQETDTDPAVGSPGHPSLAPGRYVRIEVGDTGTGMAPEILERIFDPYFTTKEPGEGTGLGLSVVQGIVRSHRGEVLVESVPGQGSRFFVYIPRAEPPSGHGSDLEPAPAEGGTEKILFVDDEPGIVNMVRRLLSHLGYSPVTTTSSRDALSRIQKDPFAFDLVITDMTMPEMTGEELAVEILKIRPGMPIILCTGHHATMTAQRAREKGIRALLLKPILREEYARVIREVLGAG